MFVLMLNEGFDLSNYRSCIYIYIIYVYIWFTFIDVVSKSILGSIFDIRYSISVSVANFRCRRVGVRVLATINLELDGYTLAVLEGPTTTQPTTTQPRVPAGLSPRISIDNVTEGVDG